MAAQQKAKKDPQPVLAGATKDELKKVEGTESDEENVTEIHPEERQKDRQKEWGTQFDKWLINAARREKTVELLLSLPYPGVSTEGNLVTGVPKRIDQDVIQIIVNGKEVWLNKSFIVGCKPEVGVSLPSAVAESN